MMESQCEYFMYFPAVPITDLSDPARYRTLPRRSHLYLGETVRFLLVLRCRDAGATPPEPGPAAGAGGFGTESAGGRAWRELAGSLCAVASVSPGDGGRHRGHHHHGYGGEADEDGEEDYMAAAEAAIAALGSRMDSRCRGFRDCRPLLIHNSSGTGSRDHQSGEVGMASFCRVESPASRLPSMLSALEEHDFLFQLHLNDTPPDEANEGLEVPLVAVLQWSTPKMPFTNCIYTHYRLPSIRLDEPRFVMTASCPSTVKVKEHFKVKYVLLNNLQDFLAVRLVWTPEGRGQTDDSALAAVVCHSPLSNLGQCRRGSTVSFRVAFQILKPGLYEDKSLLSLDKIAKRECKVLVVDG
ncbi:putative protein C7orf43 [Liparis tanakae]|uniref:Uncharacterized protein n=1 Tax=Liparis tanakae TaxID=230148 RepID=A0A4Z2IDH1_9TELE|nr:putative protein C7orf43 [Liparis tanakae]